jgi:hypothetical protein
MVRGTRCIKRPPLRSETCNRIQSKTINEKKNTVESTNVLESQP